MKKPISELLRKLIESPKDSALSQIRKMATGTFLVNITASGLSLVGTMLLTRVLGVGRYGVYSYISSMFGIAAVVVTLGFPTIIIRDAAFAKATNDWALLKALLRGSQRLTLLISLLVGIMIYVFVPYISRAHIPMLREDLILGVLLMTAAALQTLRSSSLNGLGSIMASIIPSNVVSPLIYTVFLACVLAMGNSMQVSNVFELQLFIALVILALLMILERRSLPLHIRFVRPIFQWRSWFSSSLPFLLNGILMMLNMRTDVVLLGTLKGPTYAGIYNAATTGAQLLILALGALNTVIQPAIAGAFSRNDRDEMKRLLSMMSRLGFAVSLVGLAVLWIFGGQILKVIFGPSFILGASALVILSFARTVNAGTGSVGPFLAMTGRERVLAVSLGLETVANIALNVTLIPIWGMNGSAFATGASMVFMNIGLAIWTYRKTGYDTSFIGYHSRKI